jgi:pimeloyl-ACP methyl ester carboxylesterase
MSLFPLAWGWEMPIIDVDGDKLHFIETGTGTPILFVHGSCGGGGQWKDLTAGLSNDFKCVSLDLFGSGKSESWPPEREWTTRDDERAINAVLDYLGDPAHLVIHSGGGCFSYPTIKNRRDQILSLTLFEPAYFHLLRLDNDPLFTEPAEMSTNYRAAFDDNDLDSAMASFVDVWARKAGVWAGLPGPVKAMMKLGSNRLYYEWMSPWFEEPTQSDLAALDLPVLLFKGTETIASMHRICEIIQQSLPNYRYVEINGAGHMSPFTHAKVALPVITEFLAEV